MDIIGYSTADKTTGWNFTLRNRQLAIRNLLNRLYTRKGERVMLPQYGSIIMTMIMEPLTEYNKDLIANDLQNCIIEERILRYISHTINSSENTIEIQLMIEYIPDGSVTTVQMKFDERAAARKTNGV